MYKIIDYFTNKTIAENLPTEKEAKEYKHILLKEKLKYNKDYTNYNWLLLVVKS